MQHTFDVNTAPLTTAEIHKKIASVTLTCTWGQLLILVGTSLAWLCGVFWLLTVLCSGVACIIVLLNSVFECYPYEDVSESECEDLIKACAATPEGQAYRLAVIELGRKFVNGELDALRAWADSSAARAACKILYDVPSSAAPDA